MLEVTEALLTVLRSGRPAALATVVHTSGSTPQQPGARLLLAADGSTVGTVGGGALEQRVVLELQAVLKARTPRLLHQDLTRDLGMCCGGQMDLFLEPILPAPQLVLFGAGHIAVPTARLARSIGFEVTVVDEREELNTEARFPGCLRCEVAPSDYLRQHSLGENDWVLIVTHDHRLDEEALALSTRQSPAYIGLVGSRRKVLRLVERVTARHGQRPALSRVFAPVGLELGAVTPEEIAVSIVAEWIALRHGKEAPHCSILSEPRALAAGAEPEEVERYR